MLVLGLGQVVFNPSYLLLSQGGNKVMLNLIYFKFWNIVLMGIAKFNKNLIQQPSSDGTMYYIEKNTSKI